MNILKRVSVGRYLIEGITALNCERKVKDLQSHRYSKQMLDCMFTKVSDNRN